MKRASLTTIAIAAATLGLAVAAGAQSGGTPTYVATNWQDDTVHVLDENLDSISSFDSGMNEPNGIAFDGTLIYVGTFNNGGEVAAFDLAGNEQLRWNGSFSGLMGMAYVNGELAIGQFDSDGIQFYDPAAGVLQRTIPLLPTSAVEGLTFDGASLWALGSGSVTRGSADGTSGGEAGRGAGGAIFELDPSDGTVLSSIPSPASCCGLAADGPGQLIVADGGTWTRISTADGSVLASGNNGLDMYGLKRLGVFSSGSTPCAYNPFHGFLDDGECLPLCVGHPFHPELFASVPCLAGCSLDETGAVVGSCTRIDAQPPAGSGGGALAACLAFHPPSDCQGLAGGGNGSRVDFDEPGGASPGTASRGSSGGGCAVAGGGSATGPALGLAAVGIALALVRRRRRAG